MSILQTYRRLFLSVYVPTICFAIATQAVMVLLPLYIVDRFGGTPGSLALASFVVGMRGLGMLLGDLPSGALTTKFGDKPIMILGAGFTPIQDGTGNRITLGDGRHSTMAGGSRATHTGGSGCREVFGRRPGCRGGTATNIADGRLCLQRHLFKLAWAFRSTVQGLA